MPEKFKEQFKLETGQEDDLEMQEALGQVDHDKMAEVIKKVVEDNEKKKGSPSSKKPVFTKIDSTMNSDQILNNLLPALRKSGLKVSAQVEANLRRKLKNRS